MHRIDSGFVLAHGTLRYEPTAERRAQLWIDSTVGRAARCWELLNRRNVPQWRKDKLQRRLLACRDVLQKAGVQYRDVTPGVIGDG